MDRYDLTDAIHLYAMLPSDGGLKRYAIGVQMAVQAQSWLKYIAEYEKPYDLS